MENIKTVYSTDGVLRYEDNADIYYIGTAKVLSNMVKEWITGMLYDIPENSYRSFMQDEEFKDALQIADTLDEIVLGDKHSLYKLHYIDGEGYVNGQITKVIPHRGPNFIDDDEKMIDFRTMSKDEFLRSYSYLTEEEYDNTAEMARRQYEKISER